MKIESYKEPRSSFLSISKDTAIIMDLILKNNNLKKLLHYTSKDCLSRPNLSEDESLELVGKNILLTRHVELDPAMNNYLLITFDGFAQSGNPEFRTNMIEFDIFCQKEQQVLQDFELRQHRIAAEIDSMLNTQRLTGLGQIEFVQAVNVVLENNFMGFCLRYRVYHGEEDKKNAPNPLNNQMLIDNFNEMFN